MVRRLKPAATGTKQCHCERSVATCLRRLRWDKGAIACWGKKQQNIIRRNGKRYNKKDKIGEKLMSEKQERIEPILDRTGPEQKADPQLREAKQRKLAAERAAELQETIELRKTATAIFERAKLLQQEIEAELPEADRQKREADRQETELSTTAITLLERGKLFERDREASQGKFEASQRKFEQMMAELKRMQAENRRILDREDGLDLDK